MSNKRMHEINQFLNEGNEMAIAKIAKMTDRNDHVGALIEGAKFLKHKKLVKFFEGCQAIQDAMGHQPTELRDLRYQGYEELMKYAKSKLSAEEYKAFHGAF